MTPPPDRPEDISGVWSREISTSADNAPISGSSSASATKDDVKELAESQRSSQNLLLTIMVGVVFFVVITFFIELSAMHRNYAQDKSILQQNNQLNKDYFEKVLFLNNEVHVLKTQIEVLKARNPYLK